MQRIHLMLDSLDIDPLIPLAIILLPPISSPSPYFLLAQSISTTPSLNSSTLSTPLHYGTSLAFLFTRMRKHSDRASQSTHLRISTLRGSTVLHAIHGSQVQGPLDPRHTVHPPSHIHITRLHAAPRGSKLYLGPRSRVL